MDKRRTFVRALVSAAMAIFLFMAFVVGVSLALGGTINGLGILGCAALACLICGADSVVALD